MAWTTQDQTRIVQALNLSRDQLIPSSFLKCLMDYRTSFDAQYGVDTITEIQDLLTEIEALKAQPDSAADNVKRNQIYGEQEIEFFAPGVTDQKRENAIEGKAGQIIHLLESDYYAFRGGSTKSLHQFRHYGRVIPT